MSVRDLGQKVWYDPEVLGYVMLDVTDEIKPLPPMQIDGLKLLPKKEYHCSLVAARELAKDEVEEKQIIDIVKVFLAHKAVRFKSIRKQLYVCRDKGEITVIVGANVDGLDDLRKEVKKLLPDYAPLAPHVTLLKSENSLYGIGVNSQADLKNFCEKLI